MNIQEMDVLEQLKEIPFVNQRELAVRCGCSLGMINRTLRTLGEDGYLDGEQNLTPAACSLLQQREPQRAVILAAGFGMRMVPINTETPKGLITVKGEPLIERQIHQLHQAGIREIYVIVGFMKERFEYLMDDFGVELVVNRDYKNSNNLHSLNLVKDKLSNAYIIPCDIWFRENPFRKNEMYSWYMVKNSQSAKSDVRVNRKMELVQVETQEPGNTMVGVSYVTAEDAPIIAKNLSRMAQQPEFEQAFWEETLYKKDKMMFHARVIPEEMAAEINTYEELRDLDSSSHQLKNEAIATVCQALSADPIQIREIQMLKDGVVNRSFLFTCREEKYIMRIPDTDRDQTLNRAEEAAVYQALRGENLGDDVVFIDPVSGYKVAKYISGARCCDPSDWEDVKKCMGFLRKFHSRRLQVAHSLDLFAKIEFFETLWEQQPSVYRDYTRTKEHVNALRPYIEKHAGEKCLIHFDAVPENFLMFTDAQGREEIRLIDWEYGAMQDPYVDIAIFATYSLYNREQIDRLIDIYFQNHCPPETRITVYCYVAVCGMLWSNWCEYQRHLGVEFGEYDLRQYRYAKDFYRYAIEEMSKLEKG